MFFTILFLVIAIAIFSFIVKVAFKTFGFAMRIIFTIGFWWIAIAVVWYLAGHM